MNPKLLPLLAAGVVLAACSTPQATSTSGAPNQATHATYKVQAVGDPVVVPSANPATSVPMPFFKMSQIQANIEDVDANADLFNGAMPAAGASTIAFNLVAQEQLNKAGSLDTSGQIEFQDRTRNLSFKGKVDDMSAYLSDQILYSSLAGPLDIVDAADPDDNATPKPGCKYNVDWSWNCDRNARDRNGNCAWTHTWSRNKSDCNRTGYRTQGLSSFLSALVAKSNRSVGAAVANTLDLDAAYRFSLDIGNSTPYQVVFCFKVTKVGETDPVYQYSGVSEKGKLKLMLK